MRSYRPGSHNIKHDALSCQFKRGDGQDDVFPPILPLSCMVGLLFWEIEEKVRSVTRGQAGPSACPPDCLYAELRSDVLQWAHCSRLTCHPGPQQTRQVLLQRFWCSTLEEDMQDFVRACPTCSRNKIS